MYILNKNHLLPPFSRRFIHKHSLSQPTRFVKRTRPKICALCKNMKQIIFDLYFSLTRQPHMHVRAHKAAQSFAFPYNKANLPYLQSRAFTAFSITVLAHCPLKSNAVDFATRWVHIVNKHKHYS